MSKLKTDESAKILASSISFTCPGAGAAVGATFTVCGTYNPTLKCPYRVRCRVYYLNSQNAPRELEQTFVPQENPNRWQCQFTLTDLPSQGEDLLLSARLYNSGGSPLSPLATTSAVYDSATTTDVCSGPCT